MVFLVHLTRENMPSEKKVRRDSAGCEGVVHARVCQGCGRGCVVLGGGAARCFAWVVALALALALVQLLVDFGVLSKIVEQALLDRVAAMDP